MNGARGMSAADGDRPTSHAWRVSGLSVTAALILALTGCSGTSTPPAAASAGHKSARPATVAVAAPGSPPAGRLTGLPAGRTVVWQQAVSGLVTGLSRGDQAWIVICPSLAPTYWPQQGPLQLSPAGGFQVAAYFGASARQDSGERFSLRLVLAPPAASAQFEAFQAHPAHRQGMLKLPAGVRTLDQVTVIRR
jgi:hypothetical protein